VNFDNFTSGQRERLFCRKPQRYLNLCKRLCCLGQRDTSWIESNSKLNTVGRTLLHCDLASIMGNLANLFDVLVMSRQFVGESNELICRSGQKKLGQPKVISFDNVERLRIYPAVRASIVRLSTNSILVCMIVVRGNS
jgi:hypothetical protein